MSLRPRSGLAEVVAVEGSCCADHIRLCDQRVILYLFACMCAPSLMPGQQATAKSTFTIDHVVIVFRREGAPA